MDVSSNLAATCPHVARIKLEISLGKSMDKKKNNKHWRDSKARIKLRIHFKSERHEYSTSYGRTSYVDKVKIVPLVSTMSNISIENCRIEVAWSDSIEGEPIYVKKGKGAYDYERYDGILRHDPIRKKHVYMVDERKIHPGSEYPFPGFRLKINSELTDEKNHLTVSVVARNAQRVTETFYFRYSEGKNVVKINAGTVSEYSWKEEKEIEKHITGEVSTEWNGYSLYRFSDSSKLDSNVSLWRFFCIKRHAPYTHYDELKPSEEHEKIVGNYQDEDEFVFDAEESINC